MLLRKVDISTNRSDLCSPSAKFNWRIKYNFTLDQIDPSIKYFCIMMDTKNKFCITFQVSDERNRDLASTTAYMTVSSWLLFFVSFLASLEQNSSVLCMNSAQTAQKLV